MWILFYILIVSTAIVFIPFEGYWLEILQNQFRVPKELVFVVLSSFVIALAFFDRKINSIAFKDKWIGMFLAFAVLSFGIIFYMPLIFPKEKQIIFHVWNFRATINIVLGVFLLSTLVNRAEGNSRWITTAKVLCYLAGTLAFYSILQYFGMDEIFKNYDWRFENGNFDPKVKMIGFMGHNFINSNYLAVISPLCLIFREFRFKAIYGFIVISLILSQVCSSILALIVGLLMYLLLSKRYSHLFFSIGVGIIWVFYIINRFPTFFSNNGRIGIWKTVFENNHNYLVGNGFGSLASKFVFNNTTFLHAHNDFIELYWSSGIFGLIIVIGFLCNLFKESFTVYANSNSMLLIGYISAFISFLVIALFGFPMEVAPLALVGITYIASLKSQGGVYGN